MGCAALNFSDLNPSASEMILHIPILFFFGVMEDRFRFQIIFSILRCMVEIKPLPLFLMTLLELDLPSRFFRLRFWELCVFDNCFTRMKPSMK